ncbi:uncharacterized protein LOC105007381 isoform X2 [Esox lucius]|uniref:uncharacterized protein LOC105007381 isoform X2 n=1 Tax=Esox lucius TaxID=8010 RepID=UPI00057715D1|nr:uncharacterized protein LOC105007381 isoform X2 [Esox lucius]
MCNWMVVVLSVLICLEIHQAEVQLKWAVKDRVWVTLAGQNVSFKLTLSTTGNLSADYLVCYRPPDSKEIQRWKTKANNKHVFTLQFTAHDSSYSGEYKCTFGKDEIFLALLVQDRRYQKPSERGLIMLGVLTTALLIFSVFGSLFTFRWSQFTVKNKNNRVSTGKRRPKQEEETQVQTPINASASVSVYASLESRPASVYEVMVQGAENRDSGQRKSQVQTKKSKKLTENATQGEGIFESVYENY